MTHAKTQTTSYALVLKVLVAVLALFGGAAEAQDGLLDPSFDGDGKAVLAFDTWSSGAEDIAIQADGKIVVVGSTSAATGGADIFVARFDPDGSLDTTFSGDGSTTIAIDMIEGGSDYAQGVAIQPDGKIVVVGWADVEVVWEEPREDWAIVRLNPDGSLDGSFNGDGVALVPVNTEPWYRDRASRVVVQPDGKLVVAGIVEGELFPMTANFGAVIRLHSNGNMDLGFANEGILFFGGTSRTNHVALQADGKIVITGTAADTYYYEYLIRILRLNTDGTYDATFNGTGRVYIDLDPAEGKQSTGGGASIQPDGKIVVAATVYRNLTNAEFGVIRLNPDGSLDTSFHDDGKRIFVFDMGGEGHDSAADVVVQPDGRIVLAGTVERVPVGHRDMGFVRLEPDGSPDLTFGYGAYALAPFNLGGDNDDIAVSAAIQSDGCIVVAGAVDGSSGHEAFGIARLGSTSILFFDDFESGSTAPWSD